MDSTRRKGPQKHTAGHVAKTDERDHLGAPGTGLPHGNGKLRAGAITIDRRGGQVSDQLPRESRHLVGADHCAPQNEPPHGHAQHLRRLAVQNESSHAADHLVDLDGSMNHHLAEANLLIHELEHHLSLLHGHLRRLYADAHGTALPHRKASHQAQHSHGGKHLTR
jgi:hypothetical protein